MNKKGFTLIELLAVIVILAIIALIATPIVLNIIKDSRENTIKINFDNLRHSMELYYMDNVLKEDIEFPKRIDFPTNELEIKGKQPDSGFGIIYENGKILLSVKYDNAEFVMLPGEETLEEGSYIGLEEEWLTDGKGTLHMYKKYNELDTAKFVNYYLALKNCVETSNMANDEKKTCINNIDIDISNMPTKPKNELIKGKNMYIDYLNTGVEPEYEEEKDFPILNKLSNGILDTSFNTSLKIPNYVLHSDNTLEPITSISVKTEIDAEGNKLEYAFFGVYEVGSIYFINELIFPSKIETIGESIFAFAQINNIDFSKAKDLKTIGNYSFILNNNITSLVIPKNVETIGQNAFMGGGDSFKKLEFEGAQDGTSKLREIGTYAFARNPSSYCTPDTGQVPCSGTGYLEGTLYIPASVETIGEVAFTGMNNLEVKFVGSEDVTSNLKEIGYYAFYNVGNNEEVVLPGTITKIGNYAFYGNKTKYSKMIIKKADSTGITFGNFWTKVTPTYEP